MDIVIIHGTKGSPSINWFPWARQQLAALGHAVTVPAFPTPDGQTPDSWLEALHQQVPHIDRQTILIGHSIGATFILHVLETLRAPVAQCIFVAPVMDDIRNAEYSLLNQPFVHHRFNWQKIKAHAGKVNIVCGHDDPYLPITHAQKLHANIGGGLQVVAEGGHLNAESGYTTLPQLMAFIK